MTTDIGEETQFIVREGEPEYAVVPYARYRRMVEALEDIIDTRESERVMRRVAAGEEELVPAEVVDRIDDGESPIRVWREYRGLTRRQLAEATDVGERSIYMIETGRREPSLKVLRQIADRLGVDADDLLPSGD